MTTYEIRSKAGAPIYAFDNITRARAELANRSVRVPGLRLFEVKRLERELEVKP